MHKSFVRVLGHIGIFTSIALIGTLFVTKVIACTDGKWGPWTDTSSCVANQCGTTTGTKTQSKTCVSNNGSDQCNPPKNVCDTGCPTVSFSDNKTGCPDGYSHESEKHDGYCYKGSNPDWPEDYKAMITTDTFGPINVAYTKSSDPNHCHRPTGESVSVPSWAMSDFNKLPETKNTIDVNCHIVAGDTTTQTVSCANAPITACGPTVTPPTDPTATPTPEITPQPQQPSSNGPAAGDGLSDGRSDGRSSCPDCTKAPSGSVLGATTDGQVLGASTDFAGTGVAEDGIMNIVGVLGGISATAGIILKKKFNK